MTDRPVSVPYPRDRQARLNQIRQNEEWVRAHIWNLEEDQARVLLRLFEAARDGLSSALVQSWMRYGNTDTWSVNDAVFRQRTDALLRQITEQIDQLISQAQASTLGAMERSYQGGYYGRAWILDQALRGGSTLNLPLLPADAIRAQLLSPYGGNTFIDRFSDARDAFVRTIRQALVSSQIKGDSMQEAMKRLADALGLDVSRRGADRGLRYRLEMIARTEILRASNLGALEIYEANRDVLQAWEFIATNDERTCDICGSEDGKQHPFDDEADKPPLHPNCRCSVLPVLVNQELEQRISGPRQKYEDWARANLVNHDGGVLS